MELVQVVLESGADVNHTEDSGDSVLHMAGTIGDKEIIELLIQHGADPLAQSSKGTSVLVRACISNDADMVKLFLDAGARPELDRSTIPPMHMAALKGSVAVLKLLLEAPSSMIETRQEHGYTPFLAAVDGGQVSAIELLLAHKADTTLHENRGRNALHIACTGGKPPIVEYLLAKGFDVHKVSREGLSPIHIAAMVNSVGTLDLLLARGADLNVQSSEERPNSPLATAIINSSQAAVEWMISHKADVHLRLGGNMTALLYAALHENQGAVEKLLLAGADVNVTSDIGSAPLLAAIKDRNMDMIQTLLSHGARRMDTMIIPPLTYALVTRQPEVVEILLPFDTTELDYQDPEKGLSYVHMACYLNDFAMVKSLLERAAPASLVSPTSGTPMHIAAGRQNRKIIETLIQYGATTDVRDRFGREPVGWVESPELASLFGDQNQSQDRANEKDVLYAGVVETAARLLPMEAPKRAPEAWVLGRSLLLLGDEVNAIVALELYYAPDTKDIDSPCSMCEESIEVRGYVCTRCREFDLCSTCHTKTRENHDAGCGHDSFIQIPRSEWGAWPVGVVHAAGTSVDEWLIHITEKYSSHQASNMTKLKGGNDQDLTPFSSTHNGRKLVSKRKIWRPWSKSSRN